MGVPVINPYDSIYSCWCFYVLLTDATYTAFIVPIGVGFDTSDVAWDWAGYCDFIAGQACHVNTLYHLDTFAAAAALARQAHI